MNLKDIGFYMKSDIWEEILLTEKIKLHIDKKEYFEGFMAVYECTKR
jgi:hypothetical protein